MHRFRTPQPLSLPVAPADPPDPGLVGPVPPPRGEDLGWGSGAAPPPEPGYVATVVRTRGAALGAGSSGPGASAVVASGPEARAGSSPGPRVAEAVRGGAVAVAGGVSGGAPRAGKRPRVRLPQHGAPSPALSAPAQPALPRGASSGTWARDVGARTAHLPLGARRALGGLLHALDDPELRDLLVQVRAGRGVLWLDRSGGLIPVPGWQAEPSAVERLARALVAAGGRHLDELSPCADVRLGDGIRVHAVLPPVAVAGAAVSIRVPRTEPPEFAALVDRGLCSARTAELLRAAVFARRNILVTGGTGTGKTTLLAALLDLAAPEERIVTIEDLAELRLQHPHTVALETRPASSEGVGEVGVDALLREALRMRPDRIVLGECRGAEIATLLTALNTGHDGGAGTLHASALAEVPARLEALGTTAGMPAAALARQAAAALDLVVHLERVQGQPRVVGVGRLRLGADRALDIEVWHP